MYYTVLFVKILARHTLYLKPRSASGCQSAYINIGLQCVFFFESWAPMRLLPNLACMLELRTVNLPRHVPCIWSYDTCYTWTTCLLGWLQLNCIFGSFTRRHLSKLPKFILVRLIYLWKIARGCNVWYKTGCQQSATEIGVPMWCVRV